MIGTGTSILARSAGEGAKGHITEMIISTLIRTWAHHGAHRILVMKMAASPIIFYHGLSRVVVRVHDLTLFLGSVI